MVLRATASGESEQPRPRLILASASPRRRNLLAQVGIVPDAVIPTDINESPRPGELPRPYARRIAAAKATAITATPESVVLAADTVVATGRRIFGKPADAAQAATFLRHLSGRRHRVVTALVIRACGRAWSGEVETAVRFKRLSDTEIAAYVTSGEWCGKAGGYAIQGLAAAFIPWIGGSYSNVVGLPLTETLNLLRGARYPIALDAAGP